MSFITEIFVAVSIGISTITITAPMVVYHTVKSYWMAKPYENSIASAPPSMRDTKQRNMTGGKCESSDGDFKETKDRPNFILINSPHTSPSCKQSDNNSDILVYDQGLNVESYKDYYYHNSDYNYLTKVMSGEIKSKSVSHRPQQPIMIIQMEKYDELKTK